MRILIFIICCFLLLAGCNNSPVADETNSGDTNAVETNTNGVNTEGSNSEKTNPSETTDSDSPDSEEKWPTIEVERPNMEPLHVSLDLLPEVKNALKETNDTPDRLNTTYLFERNYEYFILGYSCGSTMCNWVLVEYDPTLDSARTLDLSVFAGGHEFINRDSYLAIKFAERQGTEIVTHHIVVVDLKNWSLISPPEEIRNFVQSNYPIPEIEQKDKTLYISVADIQNPSYDTLFEWWQSDKKPVRIIEWTIE